VVAGGGAGWWSRRLLRERGRDLVAPEDGPAGLGALLSGVVSGVPGAGSVTPVAGPAAESHAWPSQEWPRAADPDGSRKGNVTACETGTRSAHRRRNRWCSRNLFPHSGDETGYARAGHMSRATETKPLTPAPGPRPAQRKRNRLRPRPDPVPCNGNETAYAHPRTPPPHHGP